MSAQTTSTCVQTAQGILTGLGAPSVSAYDQTALAATGTITVPTVTTGGVGITRGLVRIQASAVNPVTTSAIGAITATDGTRTVQVGATNRLATTAAGVVWDLLADFIIGIVATSFSFTVTQGGATAGTVISAATNASPAVLTSAGHGIPVGSTAILTITGFTGAWVPANGTFTVTSLSANTFSIPVNSTGFGAIAGAPVYAEPAAATINTEIFGTQ